MQTDTARLQRRLELGREMQACGRRRNGSFLGREHGLIVGRIALVGRPPRGDIGRQRRRADIGDGLIEHRTMKRESQRDLAGVTLGFDLGIEIAEQADASLVAEADDISHLELPGRLHQGLPPRPVDPLDQGRVDLHLDAAADPAAGELGGNDTGIVDDDLIAGAQELRQLAHDAVDRRLIRLHHQHARGIARTGRP